MKSVPERYQGDPDGDHLQSHRTAAEVAHARTLTHIHTHVYNIITLITCFSIKASIEVSTLIHILLTVFSDNGF